MYLAKNNAYSTLAVAIASGDTQIQVQTGHGDRFPTVTGSDYTLITLEDAAGNIEIAKVTARAAAADVMTIVRAQEGTAARAWAIGDIVECRLTAGTAQDAMNKTAATTAFTPAGNIAATDVQAAIQELDAEKSDVGHAHAASAISVSPVGGIAATNVQTALAELDNEKQATLGFAPANPAAVNTYTAGQRGAIVALTDGASITPDFASGNNFSVTLAGNRTLATPDNLAPGQSGAIVITQDATGGRTLAFSTAWKFAGGTVPSLTTASGAVDILCYHVESASRITASLIKDAK